MARRGKGDGSVYRRGDGRWCGKYAVELPTGQRKTRYVYAKTKKEAAAKLRAALAERDAGLVYDDGSLTVGEYLDKWLEAVSGTVKARTLERYEMAVKPHLQPALGDLRLGRLTPLQVQAFYGEKLDAGLSARSVQILHATLYKALKQAVRWRLVPRNVCEDVDPPRALRKEVRPLTAEQARSLLEAASSDPLEALYVLAVTTGMRQGELLGLKWEDVDLEASSVRVRRTVWKGEASAPKTNAARRQVALPDTAVRALRKHRERAAGDSWVFASSTGDRPLGRHNLHNRSWILLRERAGLPETVRFHDLRHTAATLLLGRGVHPKLVQSLLGHASIEITMNTYSHVMPEMSGATARAMDAALDERPALGEPPDLAAPEEPEAEGGAPGNSLPNSGRG